MRVYRQNLRDVLLATPVPGLGPGLGTQPRARSEVGTYVGIAAAIEGRAISGGFLASQSGRGVMGGLDLGVRFGVGLEGALGETGDAYRVFLFGLFDEFAQDLPALFDRFAPQGQLFPREPALMQVIEALNHHEVQPLWAEDETIGWIYQYFNSKDERKKMREASQAPRNSRELAVRNQFFTPRYVVEFLVDNTLGRLWFNATGGRTSLRERCQYLLVKPDEAPPPAIKLRDPRTFKLLDPACGSMHFGLYAFDLFVEIYREAWDWEQANGPGSLDTSASKTDDLRPLCQTFADADAYSRDVPRLIIEHNIHGVDIDPRAAQIASLAATHHMTPEQVVDEIMLKPMPKRQFISLEEITGTVEFLLSDAARNITGQCITLDGGWTAQ